MVLILMVRITMIPNRKRLLWGLLILSFILQISYLFTLNPSDAYGGGGDSGWYLEVGGNLMGGLDYSDIPIPVAPLYLIIVGIPQQFLSASNAIIAIWIMQVIASVTTRSVFTSIYSCDAKCLQQEVCSFYFHVITSVNNKK